MSDKYSTSRALLERARRSLAGGVSSPFRAKLPVPLYCADARGSRLTDVDGNEYIDYALAWGPLILGHCHPELVEAMRRHAEMPINYGAQHRLEIDVAEKIQELVPCVERMTFTSSGSEAVHVTCRLARAATKRPLILRFEGHYHGWFDSILWSYRATAEQLGPAGAPLAVAGSQGQPANESQNLLIAGWNDLDALESLFARHGDQIAAVITEPILCNSGGIAPKPGFLEGLREITTRYGALLVFDEVITGFRVGLGGAQQLFGVTPDLATFGKAIAGGATLSALGGRQEILELLGNGVAFGGSFNGNPVALGCAEATIRTLSRDGGQPLRHAEQLGERLKEGIRQAAKDAALEVQVTGHGACFWVHFTSAANITNYRDTLADRRDLLDRYLRLMLDEGILLLPEGRVYLSAVHTEADVDQTLEAVRRVFAQLADG
ncbi:MAG: aspartate aminotransferase family protein [Acidobacteria bacterium]|nr:aspartate aminotransferase family protein [Acidobacteriota bacterium]MDA1234132.1 aspartate aminotransferase family protein [Acidobacteriota bacterium]